MTETIMRDELLALADRVERLAQHFSGATGSRTQDYGEVSGQNFQMMTMHPDPEGLAADLEHLSHAAAALRARASQGETDQ